MELSEEEIWRIYVTLTRMEAAFPAMKSPLSERPIFHQLQRRVETLFLCVLAYHLLVAIENTVLDRGVRTSWWSIRQILKTHQICIILLPARTVTSSTFARPRCRKPGYFEMNKLLNIPWRLWFPRNFGPRYMGKIVTKRQPNYLILQHFGH
jgi:hypothetical protein